MHLKKCSLYIPVKLIELIVLINFIVCIVNCLLIFFILQKFLVGNAALCLHVVSGV